LSLFWVALILSLKRKYVFDKISSTINIWVKQKYMKRFRLWFISICNLLVTLFGIFYRWGSIPSWILLLCFKGKDLFSFMNVVFSITFLNY
jgi:hypothetical protein